MDDNENLLYELAMALPYEERHLAAMALRCLARHGYTSLTEIELATDWELLTVNGIGLGRLAALRRLIQPDWQLPSRQARRTARCLLSAAQLALHFWSVDDLEAALTGAVPPGTENAPLETRLSMAAFTGAAREASHHHEPDALRRIVQRASLLADSDDGSGRACERI